nr:DNA repair protein RecN [bacterium]
MLTDLYIENFGIISKTHISFKRGCNIITGETGAGKSLLIDAIRAISGFRLSQSFIKTGCDKASITAVFDIAGIPELKIILETNDIKTENEILIRRVINLNNSGKIYINDTPVGSAILKSVSEKLVELHGQFENQSLLFNKKQLEYIDNFTGSKKLFENFSENFKEYQDCLTELEILKKKTSISQSEIEWKKLQAEELSKISITNAEFENLINQLKIIEQSAVITESLSNILNTISEKENSLISIISKTQNRISSFTDGDSKLKNINESLTNVNSLIFDLSEDVKSYIENLSTASDSLDKMQNVIFEHQKLLRKYKKNSITELLDLRNHLKQILEDIENIEKKTGELEKKAAAKFSKTIDSAKKLSESRKKNANNIAKLITARLKNLSMKDAEFKIDIIYSDDNISISGGDKIEFMIKTNKGDIFKPLKNIASGGEISRVMLALKSANAEYDNIPTLIFDEIDTGISGEAAAKVAEELLNLSKSRQTMCITHQPAIAAIKGAHFKIEKLNYQNGVNVKAE